MYSEKLKSSIGLDFQCFRYKNLQYDFLWLSSPDIVMVTDEARVAKAFRYGPCSFP